MTSNPLFFTKEAQIDAESIVKGWICGVFRESSLQILRQQWNVRKSEDGVLELGINPQMLDECQRICRRLASHWEKRLVEGGQFQVATWVSEIALENDFWSRDYEIMSKKKKSHRNHIQTVEDRAASVIRKPKEKSKTLEENVVEQGSNSQLPIFKLWHLLQSETDVRILNEMLTQLGCEGNTLWPLDWKIIDDACRRIKNRLHKINPCVRFEVLPKEVAVLKEQKEDIKVKQSVRVQKLLDQKKRRLLKCSGKCQRKARASKKSRLEEQMIANARPPSLQPAEEVWHWETIKKSFIDVEKEKLEKEYIHPDNEDNLPSTALGALSSLGLTHFHLCGGDKDVENYSDKQKRRIKKVLLLERLGGKKIMRDERKRPASKVARVKTDENEHFLEFDVGECMIELGGKLHAFACVEMSLLD
mmetsp:Transcript_25835/g.29548  ORF Transcript_25835/g.29548 Transcript_25835/m.29548 type:complete len:418 (+) Transcript_25835:28-1281(+)